MFYVTYMVFSLCKLMGPIYTSIISHHNHYVLPAFLATHKLTQVSDFYTLFIKPLLPSSVFLVKYQHNLHQSKPYTDPIFPPDKVFEHGHNIQNQFGSIAIPTLNSFHITISQEEVIKNLTYIFLFFFLSFLGTI